MLFNTNEFLAFFGLFCAGYVVAKGNLFLRNLLVVVAGYVFYSAWNPNFTALLLFTSLLDFTVGWLIERASTERRRRCWLVTSIALNLGVLGIFKYFNFFRETFDPLLSSIGAGGHWKAWDIVLPVGISFYTFQSMAYVVDVYRGVIRAERSLLAFLGYVSFFPHLVAGPIQRGTTLLPQFSQTLSITADDIQRGIWLVIWGMFKKVVIADNLAPLVELVYHQDASTGPAVLLGTAAFAVQIYGDFSGYTDIAIGISRLMGFKLTLNFNLPYFATSLGDFWRRWHISLSTWLRDYLYLSLGGNRQGEGRTYLNLGITMLLGGLWHGASLTFLLWGAWHGLGLIAGRWWELHRPRSWELPGWAGWLATQAFVLYGWLLFRAGSIDQVVQFTQALLHPRLPSWWSPFLVNLLVLASPLIAMQLWQWRAKNLHPASKLPLAARAVLQGAMVLAIVAFWEPEATPFIYFQF